MISRRWRGVKAERHWAAVFFGVLIRKKKKRREKNGEREREMYFPGQIVASSGSE